jgi:toxin secretion/phage lysis holin
MFQRSFAWEAYLEKPTWWLSASLGSVFAFALGTTGNEPVRLALSFILCDFATGLLKGVSGRSLSSRTAMRGFRKKCAMLLAVTFGHIVDQAAGTGNSAKALVSYYVIGGEAVSVMENLAAMGVILPPALSDLLNSFLAKSGAPETGYRAFEEIVSAPQGEEKKESADTAIQ